VAKSKSLSEVDLSGSALTTASAGTLTAWMRRSTLTALVCRGVSIVSKDNGQVDKQRTSIAAAETLVRAMGDARCKVECLVLTLEHPLQEGKGEVGVVSDKELRQLVCACQSAAAGTSTGKLMAVGLHPAGQAASAFAATGGGQLAELERQIWRALRAVVNTVLPFLVQLADNDVESVLVSNELEHAGKTGGVATVFRCCRDLHATNPHLLYLLLWRVPSAFALDMRVLFHRILPCYSHVKWIGKARQQQEEEEEEEEPAADGKKLSNRELARAMQSTTVFTIEKIKSFGIKIETWTTDLSCQVTSITNLLMSAS
jgi:hypothetical protein